jgi:hypothetical protein
VEARPSGRSACRVLSFLGAPVAGAVAARARGGGGCALEDGANGARGFHDAEVEREFPAEGVGVQAVVRGDVSLARRALERAVVARRRRRGSYISIYNIGIHSSKF